MSGSETQSISQVPKWNMFPWNKETCSRYISKVKALVDLNDCGDAMDETMMANCPTKSEYDALDLTSDDGKEKARLWKINKRAMAVITLGQESDHGLAMVDKTKSREHPHGKAHKVVEMLMKKNKPSDASAEIELESELEKLSFSNANDYYNDVVAIMAQYDVDVSDTTLIKAFAKKVKSSVYSKMTIDHLNSGDANDFEELCNNINEVQRLTRSTQNPKEKPSGKEVQLANADGEEFRGNCGKCGRYGHKRVDCKQKKQNNGGGSGGSGNGKTCNHCGGKGHLEAACFKKHPEKAPQWYKNMVAKKKEAAGASIEMMIVSVEQDFPVARL